jgi:hypothetical protein
MKVNLYSPDECRVWFHSYQDGDDVGFETLERCVIEVGEQPEWFNVIDDLLEVFDPGPSIFTSKEDWSLTDRGTWLLEEGIAPGQAFQLRITEPRWYCTESMDGTEYDVEYFYDVIGKANWTASQTVNAWCRFLKQSKESLAAYRKATEREIQRRKKAVKHMAVRRVEYGGYYDDYIPDHFRYELLSTLTPRRYYNYTLAQGDGQPYGQEEDAMYSLFQNVQKNGIKLTLEQLKKLPKAH